MFVISFAWKVCSVSVLTFHVFQTIEQFACITSHGLQHQNTPCPLEVGDIGQK